MALSYTLQRLFTEQAVVERDTAGEDAYGASTGPNFEYHATVPCRLWWDKSSGARAANRVYVSPSRTVPTSVGGMIVPLGTDINENDRVTAVRDRQGNPKVDGIFQVSAVLYEEDHIELDLVRVHLGS